MNCKLYKNHSEKINKIKTGELSLVQNVNDFLLSIEKKKNLNAFNFVFDEEAKQTS